MQNINIISWILYFIGQHNEEYMPEGYGQTFLEKGAYKMECFKDSKYN